MMIQNVERTSNLPIDRSIEIAEFLDFLDDKMPALFVAESISTILRTEPPVAFETEQACEIVAVWARDRAGHGEPSVADLMVRATRKIVEAYRGRIVTGIDPRVFYRAFVQGLADRCPASEHQRLQSGLRQLQAILTEQGATSRQAEFDQTDSVEIQTKAPRREDRISALTKRIEANPRMPASEFDEVEKAIREALASRVGLSIRSALTRIGTAALAQFNAGEVARASAVFEIANRAMDRLQLSPGERDEVRSALRSAALDGRLLAKWLANHEIRRELAPVVEFFADLEPAPLVDRLEREPSRDHRRMLLQILEMHGEAALPVLIDRLESARSSASWYLARNLIYLVAHLRPNEESSRRRLVSLLAPYTSSAVPQLRGVALAALKRIGGREILPALVRALDPASYPASAKGADGTLERHVSHALELLASLDVESATVVVAEFATGVRGSGFEFEKTVREAAIQALTSRGASLPRRAVLAIVDFLRQQSERKIKFVVGGMSLGVDLVSCRRLMKLIAGSTEPEAVDVLATPFMPTAGGARDRRAVVRARPDRLLGNRLLAGRISFPIRRERVPGTAAVPAAPF